MGQVCKLFVRGRSCSALAPVLLCVLISCTNQNRNTRPTQHALYKNPSAPVERRISDLLARMTLEEKADQLRGVWQIEPLFNEDNVMDPDRAAKTFGGGIGQVAGINHPAEQEVAMRNAIQKYLIEQTRLGIPAIMHDEGCHGFKTIGATSFPAPIGIACSWDPRLIEQIYTVVSSEMSARGVRQALTPIVDICRDPRWGRTDETMGEDPYLNGKLGAAMVRGFQGSADGTIGLDHVAATLKHFAAHGAPEGGINRGPNDVPLREMYDAHLVPFRIAIADSHPAAVMPAYTEVNGVPAHNNPWLLHDVLRNEWGFKGLVVSDYSGVEYLATAHHVAADLPEAAQKALTSGVDMNLPSGESYPNLPALVRQGRVKLKTLDQAVARVLRLKFQLGLFEHPYGDAAKSIRLANLDSSKSLARKAAQESIVLLKNRDDLLPLSTDRFKTIAVIGPNAASARLGGYSGEPLYKVSILDGIRSRVGDRARVVYSEGCKIISNLPESSAETWRKDGLPLSPTTQENRDSIAAAVNVAKDADAIVLVIGENEWLSRESWGTNHLGDSSSIELPGAQNELANALFALGKPVVVYLMNGRPLAVPQVAEKADALLEGWYMGQETGNAAADVLFGDVNPSGKLTITIPRATGQIPVYYDHKPGARIYNYIDLSNKPLFPFGFGLSYTHFDYSAPTLSATSMPAGGRVTVSSTITNSGSRPGDEVVQFYIHQKVSSVTRPVMELRGFQRISLAPGETKTVAFTVDRSVLAFHDVNMKYVAEPGDYELMIGPSSSEPQKVTLRVVK